MKNINYYKTKHKILITIFAILLILGFLFYNKYASIYQEKATNSQSIYILKYIEAELSNCKIKNIACLDDFLKAEDFGNKEN